MTATFASHSDAAASEAERRSLACSLSISFRCMRSVMLSDDAYSAFSSCRACSSVPLTCSYSLLTYSACSWSLSSVVIHTDISFILSSSLSLR